MFRRGGSTSTGIMDGFGESTRPNFTTGGSAATLMEQVEAEFPEPEMETGFDTQDYLSLAKLGFSVAGAPGGGPGLSGLMQAASPALQDFTDDLSSNRAAREEVFNTANKDRRDARLAAMGTDYEIDNQKNQLDAENKNKLEQIRLTADLDQTEFEKMTSAYQAYSNTILTSNDPAEIMAAYNSIGVAFAKVTSPIISKFDNVELVQMKKAALAAMDKARETDATVPEEGDDGYDSYYNTYFNAQKNKTALESLGIYLDNLDEIVQKARTVKAEGGRIGYANGGGPYEPGSGPDPDPGSPPIMQASPQALSYQELRSRLPSEVSDQVVRLLANSEEALFVFANIETQEDIANFNKRFNADLRMPAQTAV